MGKSQIVRLKRELTLKDVYAICTGAAFSSGFFLLPGIAFAQAGAWVIVAYLASAILVIPALLSKAELATAMPRAGGDYFFLDRSLGPLAGTVGGLGTWIAMGLKNTFALIGMGAYLALVVDLDITWVAIALTFFFTGVNILSANETARLQRYLVFSLVAILTLFLISGLGDIGATGFLKTSLDRLAIAPATDADGVLATIGLVFVSYAGLTKVAGVAEEVDNPARNIPLGMALSLLTAVVVYVVGSFILVVVLDHQALASDLTPIASAATSVFDWMPGQLGLWLIIVAATAAFASTANAGILAASRYMLAMGRDRVVSDGFSQVGRFGTPTLAVLATGAFIVIALLTLDVVTVAKLASAFQLLLFALVNIAVIVMRESGIDGYEPEFRSPLYPWMQIVGIFASAGVIIEMGRLPMLFTLGLIAFAVAWFFWYVQPRVVRHGAILHWFERLGRERFDALEDELREIIAERGLAEGDVLEEALQRALVLDLEGRISYAEVADQLAGPLAERLPLSAEQVRDELLYAATSGAVPVFAGVALPHFRVSDMQGSELVMIRARDGVEIALSGQSAASFQDVQAQALFVVVSPEADPGVHLRMLARLASLIEEPDFLETWLAVPDAEGLRAAVAGDTEVWDLAHALIVRRRQRDSPQSR